MSNLTDPMRVLVVAGARPNFMKVGPVLRPEGDTAACVDCGRSYRGATAGALVKVSG